MNNKALYKLSYGLFVVTANQDGKDNGCITNTAIQAASGPDKITFAINKNNLTHDMILATGKYTVSVLSTSAEFDLYKHFGFQSGRDVDKFKDFNDVKRLENGTLCVTKGTNAYFSGNIIQTVDLGSHTLFIADISDMEVLSDEPSATYEYYRENVKPKPVDTGKKQNGQTVWRCTICGYEYVGEELPEDFICPLCKHPASDFEKVTK
ncbi:MAG: flavin reductase [Lachnospiraceae bacterium]